MKTSNVEIVLPPEVSGFTASAICARLQERDVDCNVHLAGNLDAGRMLDQARHSIFVNAEHKDLAWSMVEASIIDDAVGSPVPGAVRIAVTSLVLVLVVLPLAVSALYALARMFF